MGLIRLSGVVNAKKKLLRSLSDLNQASSKGLDVRRGYFAVYVGESQKKRFVVPIYLLNKPCFQELLCEAEEEFGYEHPMGGITISCGVDFFSDLICRLTE